MRANYLLDTILDALHVLIQSMTTYKVDTIIIINDKWIILQILSFNIIYVIIIIVVQL